MSNHSLYTLSADGAVVPASSETILIAARQVLAHRVRRGASLQSPQKAGEYLMMRLGHLDYEVFGLILLDLCGVSTYVEQSLELKTSAEEGGDSSQHY
jgi:DNA repair protein RadC